MVLLTYRVELLIDAIHTIIRMYVRMNVFITSCHTPTPLNSFLSPTSANCNCSSSSLLLQTALCTLSLDGCGSKLLARVAMMCSDSDE